MQCHQWIPYHIQCHHQHDHVLSIPFISPHFFFSGPIQISLFLASTFSMQPLLMEHCSPLPSSMNLSGFSALLTFVLVQLFWNINFGCWREVSGFVVTSTYELIVLVLCCVCVSVCRHMYAYPSCCCWKCGGGGVNFYSFPSLLFILTTTD